jgi:ATP-dependent RNA helicase DHX36
LRFCATFSQDVSPFQESSDGQRMMEFRHSLPAYKERQALLEAISQNQVLFLFRHVSMPQTYTCPLFYLTHNVND